MSYIWAGGSTEKLVSQDRNFRHCNKDSDMQNKTRVMLVVMYPKPENSRDSKLYKTNLCQKQDRNFRHCNKDSDMQNKTRVMLVVMYS